MQNPAQAQSQYNEEERDSSEDFDIILNEEQEKVPEKAPDLLDAPGIDVDDHADKPWNRPGEDITDYFNYGFNEATWKEYIAKQKRLRDEYGGREKRWPPEKRDPRHQRSR